MDATANNMSFEPVIDVREYYDGPRCGIAMFQGKRCTFKSRYLDSTEYQGDFESVDLFEINLIESGGSSILATAVFRPAPVQQELPLGELRPLEVSWQVVSESDVQLVAQRDCPASGGSAR